MSNDTFADPSINSGLDIWTDRRVKIGYETAEELAKHYNPLNFRGHPENQRSATEESLDALGYVGQVKKSLHSGVILDGHLRIEIALAKDPSIQLPVDYYDLTPDEELLALQVLDTTTEMAQPIADKLAALMERTKHLTADKPGLAAMLEQLKVRAGVNGANGKGKDIQPQDNKAKELAKRWGTKSGQIWQLGEHRLIIGDCTDKAVIEALMKDKKAEAVITDPPYAFGLSSTSEMATKSGGWHDIMNNSSWFVDRYKQWAKLLDYNGPTWVFCNWRTLPILMRAGFESGFGIDSVMVWYKDWIGPGGTKALRPTYELIALTILGAYVIPDRSVEDFFKAGWSSYKPTGHKAEKPVELLNHLVTVSNVQMILDPFCGSGTTIIACENLSRCCWAAEIDEGYAAVSIQRWVDLTGQQPRLISG